MRQKKGNRNTVVSEANITRERADHMQQEDKKRMRRRGDWIEGGRVWERPEDGILIASHTARGTYG